MAKGHKIKRYGGRYRHHRSALSRFIRGSVVVAVVCVLGFVGWSAYEPVMEYLSGIDLPESRQTLGVPSSSAVEQEPASSTPDASGVVSQPDTVQQPDSDFHAIYLPTSLLADEVGFTQTLESLSNDGVNAVLFDLKNTAGQVLYTSALPEVEQAQAAAAVPYDLATLCARLKEKGITPIGRLPAFRDPLAANRLKDAGVTYQNSEMLWLDNYKESGGKPWLNPYSKTAQDYLCALAAEAVSLGVGQILLDNYSFPVGYALEYATYGPEAQTVSRTQVLSAFIDRLDQQISELGGRLSLYVSGPAALGNDNEQYGTNPLELSNGRVTLGVMPAQFGDNFVAEGFVLKAPVTQPQETVDALLKKLAPRLTGMRVTAMLQAYNAPTTVQNNLVYTAVQVDAQRTALADNGIKSYIVYNPDGSYPK